MELLEAVQKRHSVRMYQDREIPDSIKKELLDFISQCNQTSGLNIQLILDEPKAFDNFMAHYGKFSGVKNYLALIGKKSVKLEEMCGYYGEKIVLKAQQLGLNSCWVIMELHIKLRRLSKLVKLLEICLVGLKQVLKLLY